MSAPLEFHDAPPPPGSGQGLGKLGAFRQALKANPGKWAKAPEQVNTSNQTTLKAEGFHSVTRNTDRSGKCDLWAMWPGDESQVQS